MKQCPDTRDTDVGHSHGCEEREEEGEKKIKI